MNPAFSAGGNGPAAPHPADFVAEAWALACEISRYTGTLRTPDWLPRGDGHAVLMLPALFSCDFLTRGFRRGLAGLGYRVEGWGGGINLGPTQADWDRLSGRLTMLAAQSGCRVSLVGHSLGGVLARALAQEHPALVRRVTTICSPFRLPVATPLAPVYRLLSLCHADSDILLARVAAPPPVPTTAIYAPRDGVVAWASCIDEPAPGRENLAVPGRHTTMLANPATLRAVAESLALPDRHGSGCSRVPRSR